MFKQIITLYRGVIHNTAEDFTDRNALPLLQQQIRDAAKVVASAKKSVALAMAQNHQELQQNELLKARIEDLEQRAVSALEKDKQDLAREAAEMIAILETERTGSIKAQKEFASGLDKLKANVRNAETRLRDLQRGERIAAATDKAQRLRQQVPENGTSHLTEAEETLSRLQKRQQQMDLTAEALNELDGTEDPAHIVEKLAEAGCGTPLRTQADDVLKRLSKKAKPKPKD